MRLVELRRLAIALAAALAACGQEPGGQDANRPAATPAAATPAPRAATAPADPLQAQAAAINDAQVAGPVMPAPAPEGGAPPPAPAPAVIKAEVLLARAHASPGVFDGLAGANLERAVAAFETMQGLPADGRITPAVWSKLVAVSSAPVAGAYQVTAADVAGPFYPDYGENMVAASKLPATGYDGPRQALAARFHMSEDLMKALNPGGGYDRAGARILVTLPQEPPLPRVARMEVDKSTNSLRAYDGQGRMVASFPVTIGSVAHKSPTGTRRVVDIQFNPVYTYDPAELTWGPKSHGKFSIRPGPNNPVGLVWIGLDAPGYGIHGAPGPSKIGKTQSHGCVRLTNWDALALAHAVRDGVPVEFVDSGQAPARGQS